MDTTFHDCKGNAWEIELNALTVMRLKATGFNILELENEDAKGLKEILNPQEFTEALTWVWRIVSLKPAPTEPSQADLNKISTLNTFMSLMKGDAIRNARRALLDAYKNFSPSKATQSFIEKQIALEDEMFRKMEQANEKLLQLAQKTAKERLEKISDENIEKRFYKALSEQDSQNKTPQSLSGSPQTT